MFISMYEFSDYERYLLEVKHRTKLNKYDKGKVYTINKSNHLFVHEAVLKYEIYKNKATQVPV